jgi:hypothetical protein
LIREINGRVHVNYNEQLDRQYAELSRIDRYVVDNYNELKNGFHLGMINIPNCDPHVIGKKIASLSEQPPDRIYKTEPIKKYSLEFAENKKGQRVIIYKLKCREQMKELWNIIDYKRFQEGDE